MTNELDGVYRISSTSNYDGPLERRSDGQTEIRDGRTSRTDGNGVVWTSTFRVLSDSEVEMVSVADPANARGDFALLRPDGAPTRGTVTYRSVLRLSRQGDRVQMSGSVEYGNEIVMLTLRRVTA